MPSFIENIYTICMNHNIRDISPITHQKWLLVSDFNGQIFEVVGLPDEPKLIKYGDLLGSNISEDLSSFSLNVTGTYAIARFWCLQTTTFIHKLYSIETKLWMSLVPPSQAMDGTPQASSVLGFWVENEIVIFSEQARFGRLREKTLFWSRYNLQGQKIAEHRLMLASERGPRPFATRDTFWYVNVNGRAIAYAWDRFFAFDCTGVTELPAPSGLGLIKSYSPSCVHNGKILLFSHNENEEEAFLYDIDLVEWKSTRKNISMLLRGPRNSNHLWMPRLAEAIYLCDDWVLLNLHDGDPLNRIACWLWERSTNRAWGVPIKETGNRESLTFGYLVDSNRFIAINHDEIIVSRNLEQIVADLQALPNKAKVLPFSFIR